MQTTKKIWDEKDARRHEIAPLVTKLFFQGKQLDPELLKELETLREFFNTHIDPQVDEIQLTSVMSLDLEKLTKIGDKISDCLVGMKELKIFMNSRNQDDEVTYEELQERYDTMYGEYEELRLLQINFQEKFLMTYDQSHKFYNPKIK